MLLRLYTVYADAANEKKIVLDPEASRLNGHMNGSALTNGHARGPTTAGAERQSLRDAEEFELDGLMSDDDEPDGMKERRGLVNGQR